MGPSVPLPEGAMVGGANWRAKSQRSWDEEWCLAKKLWTNEERHLIV
jgi:hypothetical protein